jgi:hypothetical protein
MKLKLTRSPLLAAALAAGGLSDASAATPLPGWYGEPDTTRQGYLFTDGSLTPAPEIIENPYGTPVATVTTGGFSDGWQDPLAPFDLAGVADDGAWDLGTAGAISVILEVAENPPEPGTFYRIEFQVYAVAYFGITALPGLETIGLTPENLTVSQTLVATDPGFPGASWQGLKWTGSFDNVTTNQASFALKAPSDNISVVDTFEVFTQVTVVPEPSAALMMLTSLLAWSLRRSRS